MQHNSISVRVTDTTPFPPAYIRELNDLELRLWHKLRRIKAAGAFTTIIEEIVLRGDTYQFRELIKMIRQQIYFGASKEVELILGAGIIDILNVED